MVNVGVFLAFTALSAIIFSFFSPIVISRASELQTNFDAVVNPVASVSLDANSIVFNITPTSSGVFQSKSVVATVNTNSTGGYELYFSSENDSTDMVNADVADVISSTFDGAVDGNSMPANSWGFSIDNNEFKKIPVASTPAQLRYIDGVPEPSEKETTVYVGMKINDAIASGTYLKTVKVSVLAHESATPFDGITRMQDMTPELCARASSGEMTTLRDSRDAKTYTVRKLTDGRCWMTENLAITDKTITSADSDLPSGETYTIPASNVSDFTTAYNTSAAYYDADYGGSYNFYTATAGTGGTSLATDGANAPSSICPKGWRLPTKDEFGILYNKYNSPSLMQGVPNFTLSGGVDVGSVMSQGSGGLFWSSTVNDASLAYYLGLNSSYVLPAGGGAKYSGLSVRCVVPKTTSTQTMQTFDESTLPNVGDSATLEDERDGTMYNVKRLPDGKVWMTQNLSIAGKTITSADSDLPSGETYTIPASSKTFPASINTSAVYIHTTYGGHYNFYTATAGWGTSSVTSGNSPKSICPKGWRLPTSGEDGGDFKALTDNYNDYHALMGEPGFTLSGYTYNKGGSTGWAGYYWSSTAYDADNGYIFIFTDDNRIDPADDNEKSDGIAVRCIAKEPTMQTFDKTTLTNVGDSISLKDERDGNFYTVKKLADGNVWMTQNLALGKNEAMTLTPTDSDVASNFEIPASNEANFTTTIDTKAVYIDNTYGGYYNYYTATVGEGGTAKTSGDVEHSICPKGWRLPTSTEFQTLYNNYNSSALMQGVPNFTLSGFVSNGLVDAQGSDGQFWSSTVNSANLADGLGLDSPDVYPAGDNEKDFGFSVRCVAI